MADFRIAIPDSMNVPKSEVQAFEHFLQQCANRRAVGHLRYGKSDAKQKYMSRLEAGFKTYRRTGNREQLLNIAVYAFLESYAPENPKHHHDPLAGSATRKKFGGNIA